VERLLAEGADPWTQDCNRRLPLHFAAEAGHLECVCALAAWMRQRVGEEDAGGAEAPPGAGEAVDLLNLPVRREEGALGVWVGQRMS
jgi:hypothetical protein